MSPVNSAFRVQIEPGKYLIGRSAVALDDACFINLESPRSAVSRNHATIEFCRNGDAWLEDNASTNGTFLAIREGEGLRLQPQHFYQLTSGALIVFGDMEIRFIVEPRPDGAASTPAVRAKSASRTAPPHQQQQQLAPSPAPKLDPAGLLSLVAHLADFTDVGSSSGVDVATSRAGNASTHDSRLPQGATEQQQQGTGAATPAGDTRNSNSSGGAMRKQKEEENGGNDAGIKAEPRHSATGRGSAFNSKAAAKRGADEGVAAADVAPPPTSRPRRDDARPFRSLGSAAVACLTGFDSRARLKCAKAVQSSGGTVEGEWSSNCNLLIVNESPTGRTPKLIMAVAQGRDVVVPAYVEKPDVAAADACPAVLSEGGVTISSAKLRDAIWKYRDLGLPLKNRSFFTSNIEPKATRDQVNTIVKACGGTIAKAKAGSTVLLDADLNEFYNSILRGEGISR